MLINIFTSADAVLEEKNTKNLIFVAHENPDEKGRFPISSRALIVAALGPLERGEGGEQQLKREHIRN